MSALLEHHHNQEKATILLGEIMSALSFALDLTEGQPPGHCVRCAWIGLHVGQQIGLDERSLADLYFTLLMKDLGCSSNAARICALFMTDDREFKKNHKTVDGSFGQVMSFILQHTALEKGLAERFRTVFNVIKNVDTLADDLITTRCERGAEIAAMMRFSEDVCDGIRALDEHWDGGGQPLGLKSHDIPLYARIALLSQVVDVFHMDGGEVAATVEVRGRSGKWFDPDLVNAFNTVAEDPDFWEGLRDPDLEKIVFDFAPARVARVVDEDYLDDIARAFARVIDAKSPFTHGHSERVALYTDVICAELGYEDGYRRWMKRAALLHDIGKLGVSNAVLDKPDRLTDDEYEQIKKHATYSEQILRQIAAFDDLATVAAAHHERLDGKGYPKGLTAADLTQDMRILAVADIFDALSADRPYRAAMPFAKINDIMEDLVGCAIDETCWQALVSGLQKTTDL